MSSKTRMKPFNWSAHKRMWTWLAENPGKWKLEWPGWEQFKERAVCDCFACDYADKLNEDAKFEERCLHCPFLGRWTGSVAEERKAIAEGVTPCCLDEALFDQWDAAANSLRSMEWVECGWVEKKKMHCSKLARKIANLKPRKAWRGKWK